MRRLPRETSPYFRPLSDVCATRSALREMAARPMRQPYFLIKKLTNGMTVQSTFRTPLSFMISELFQIDRGKIDQVEAVIDTVPYKMRNDIWDRPQ